MECYNSHTKQWSHVAPMHYSRSCFATAVCDGYLYALGGYGPSYLRTVERYDPASNSWEMMPAMSTYRINFGVGVLNGCLYVVGEQLFYISSWHFSIPVTKIDYMSINHPQTCPSSLYFILCYFQVVTMVCPIYEVLNDLTQSPVSGLW